MKKGITVFCFFLVCGFSLKGQTIPKIEISFDKKVILLFEDNIKGYEIGDSETIGCVVEENRLIIQSSNDYKKGNFYETNLFIWTDAGYYFSFLIDYKNDIKTFFYVIENGKAIYGKPKVANSLTNKTDYNKPERTKRPISVDSVCSLLVGERDYLYNIGSWSDKMELLVGGIYVDEKNIYIETWLDNSGDVRYDVDVISFFIQGKGAKKWKKTAVIKEHIIPNYIYNDAVKSINGRSSLSYVFVFDRFTIDEDKKLVVGFYELNGARNMEAVIRAKNIINARSTAMVISSVH